MESLVSSKLRVKWEGLHQACQMKIGQALLGMIKPDFGLKVLNVVIQCPLLLTTVLTHWP